MAYASRIAVELLRPRRESLAPATHLAYRALDAPLACQQLSCMIVGAWHAIGLASTAEKPHPATAVVPVERILGTVQGGIPTFARNGVLEAAKPSDFIPNPDFVSAIHSAIQRALLTLQTSDEIHQQAELHDGGWFLIRDPRAPTHPRRGPEPEEFFGGVKVKDQLIVADSYTPNPFYKVLSPLFGYSRLPPFLQQEFDSTFPIESE